LPNIIAIQAPFPPLYDVSAEPPPPPPPKCAEVKLAVPHSNPPIPH